ncbi:Hypothetical protein R9X50_00475100 [Acrodontium crateriforme]|uniref:Major facilitator superfamily transporter n=1 Tax=Acrodontium crateriforme TaxID=150365 RepID=A0AAQ3M6M0_9PEZI|nr:Hypothetical protein R9X50_00475100 [Acrodontium crateriforme]
MPTHRYRSLSGAERQRYSAEYDEDVPSLISSRERLDTTSFRPILGKSTNGPSLAYHLPRRRFTRYFTLAIASIILLFMFYLLRSSWSSEMSVRAGLHKPPPPPPAWEQFPFLKRYNGGIRSLISRSDNKPEFPATDAELELERLKDAAMEQKTAEDTQMSKEKGLQKRESEFVSKSERFNPFPDYKSESYTKDFESPVPCYLDSKTKATIPHLLAYKGVTQGFADPAFGSHKVLGLRDDVCFERYGRLGPYGLGYSVGNGGSGAGIDGEREGSEQVWGEVQEVDYRNVKWSNAQQQCMEANAHRFKPADKKLNHFYLSAAAGGPVKDLQGRDDSEREESKPKPTVTPKTKNGKKFVPRTAVVIRTWWDYEYDAEDLFYLRSLINELSIQSGSEYVVHFLIHVKDDNKQIWADDEIYQQVLNDSLPEEFRGMGTLWSERQMGLIYGGVPDSMYRDLPVHGAYRSTNMPLQYFAHMHPEYDFFWHWEMDIRYTGHFYHFFSKVAEWAKEQPRKGLWERNERFYVPSEHGSWEDFRHMVRVQIEHGTASKQNLYGKLSQDAGAKHPMDEASRRPDAPVWGPLRPSGEGDTTADPEMDPQPPTSYEKDDYEWGVGEEADLITFNPLFDPHNTNWILAEDVTGYNTTDSYPPRRTAIITASRLSRRLLETMHREVALERHTMFSEMWPGSCALHHGYKAVYAPHPVYIDRAWPTSYLAAIFNNGRNGASGGARTSVFSDERQHNFRGTSWYYNAGFAPNLWKRWLGYKVDNDGGEEWELANEGRMCLPAMLLHPIKQVDLVYEHKGEDE